MKTRVAIALMCLMVARIGAAQEAAVGGVLQAPVSVRASGMGEAYTAAEDDVFGIHYNPAVILTGGQVGFLYQRGLEGDTAEFVGNTGALAAGMPTSWGKMAGSLVYYDAGSITLNDNLGNSRTVSAQKDMLGTVSTSFSPAEEISVGTNFKMLHSQFLDQFSGTAYLFDAGTIYKPVSWMNLGFAVQNMGTGLRYAGLEEKIPTTFRGGVALRERYLAHRTSLALDVLTGTDGSSSKVHTGIEYWYANTIALRVGYKFGYDSEGVSFGGGFALDKATVDIAIAPSSVTGTTVRLSVALRY